MPILKLQIQTTSLCNARCFICPHFRGLAETGVMSDEVFDQTLKACKALGPLNKVALYMQGEPLTDPKLEERILRVSKDLSPGFIEISTNGALLTGERRESLVKALTSVPSLLIVSFHGMDQKEYEYLTGLDFVDSLQRVKAILRDLEGTQVRRRIVGAGQFFKVVPRLQELFGGFKASFGAFSPNNRAGQVKGAPVVSTPVERFTKCVRLTGWVHIDWTGNVVLCCNDYTRSWTFGHVMDGCLDELRETFVPEIRRLADDPELPCCQCDMNCV